jgi:hypothetical protein
VDKLGNVVTSWLATCHSAFVMAHRRLNTIWANYTISPDPLSGTPSLHEACVGLMKHSLQPEDIVGEPDSGFVLHADLGHHVLDVCTTMDFLLKLATKHHGRSSISIGTTVLQVVTGTTGLDLHAPEIQIITSWLLLLQQLANAVHELKHLCIGNPHSRSHLEPPLYSQLVALLSPNLRGKH